MGQRWLSPLTRTVNKWCSVTKCNHNIFWLIYKNTNIKPHQNLYYIFRNYRTIRKTKYRRAQIQTGASNFSSSNKFRHKPEFKKKHRSPPGEKENQKDFQTATSTLVASMKPRWHILGLFLHVVVDGDQALLNICPAPSLLMAALGVFSSSFNGDVGKPKHLP